MGLKNVKSRIIGLVVTGILTMLIVSVLMPPATAVLISSGTIQGSSSVTIGNTVTFQNINLTIRGEEKIPVTELNFSIYNNKNGALVAYVTFSVDGTEVNEHPSGKFTVTNTNTIQNAWYGYGYGYGYDEPTGPGYTFGYGYGYGYGINGYSNISFLYNITYTTHMTGTFYWKFSVNATSDSESHIYSNTSTETFTVRSSSGTSGGTVSTNTHPVADAAGPYTGYISKSITFNGQNSYDSDGTIVNWTWNIGNDLILYGETPTYTFTSEEDIGNCSVTLTVTDDDGATNSDSTSLEVKTILSTQMPVPVLNGPYIGTIGHNITLDASESYDDGTLVNYTWILGDSTTLYGAIVNHSYTAIGTYTITLIVTDDDGFTNSTTTQAVIYIGAYTDEINGDFIDSNDDGIYDEYINQTTGISTHMMLLSNGKYLIDDDNDGEWDYIYDPATSEITEYTLEEKPENLLVWFAVFGVIAAVGLILFVLFKKGYIYVDNKKK